MKTILSEKNIVVVLFVMVLITFSLAQEDSKKMERIYTGVHKNNARQWLVHLDTSAPSKTDNLR
jgi:hypothetical protein